MTRGWAAFTEAPDLIRPIIGFRQWRVQRLEGTWRLTALMSEVAWSHRVMTAHCPVGRHASQETPAVGCTCGLYAWYRPSPRTAALGFEWVNGAVAMWGQIELHATGMRAQHARILALTTPLSPWKKRRMLETAEPLGVPLVPHRELVAVALGDGTLLPEELRPPTEWGRVPRGPIGVVPRLVSSAIGSAPARSGPAHSQKVS